MKHAKKKPTVPTQESLAHAALRYLSRYAASEKSLRRVLNNQIRRATSGNTQIVLDDERISQLKTFIDIIIDRHKKSGALNDAAYAELKINSFRRSGRSRQAIQQKLSTKGVDRKTISEALDKNDDHADPMIQEIAAARRLAQRRKLGPFRNTAADPVQKRKDLATMARAGFSFAVARQVLKAEDIEEDFN